MPKALPMPIDDPVSSRPIDRVDALGNRLSRVPALNPLVRMTAYLAGRRDGARLEWTLEHGVPDLSVASHWLERNQRDFLQVAQRERSALELRVAPAGRELRALLQRLDVEQAEVQRLRTRLAELDALAPVTVADIVRAPGELRMQESIVLSRRIRKRAAELEAVRRAFDAARLRLARDEERRAELLAVVKLSIRRTIGEVERLRAHYGRRAEVAARGVAHRSPTAASALGLLHGVSVLPLPAWVDVDVLERALLPQELLTLTTVSA